MATTDRRRLDREDVLKAAEELVDRDGWRNLTMAALAAELGVKPSSLYNHVKNLSSVLDDIRIRAFGMLNEAFVRAAVGRSGARGLRALADAMWTYARTYPSRYDLAMRLGGDRGDFLRVAAEKGDALGAIVDSYGLEGSSVELQFTVFAALHGVIELANNGVTDGVVNPDVIYERMLVLVGTLFENDAAPQSGADQGGSDLSKGKS